MSNNVVPNALGATAGGQAASLGCAPSKQDACRIDVTKLSIQRLISEIDQQLSNEGLEDRFLSELATRIYALQLDSYKYQKLFLEG